MLLELDLIVLGGHHVTALPFWADDNIEADGVYIIQGEGECSFNVFCEHVEKGDMESPAFQSIFGLGYSDGDYFEVVPRNEVVLPLDRMPQPAWGYFLLNSFPVIQIFTSRGCPFNCFFCSSSCFWGEPRYHSPKRVVQDVLWLRDAGVQSINIYDDLFAMDKFRVGVITTMLRKSGVNHSDIVFSCLGRASVMDAEMAQLLANMGVHSIAFGFESGSPRMLKRLKGPSATVEKNFEAVEHCRRVGMNVVGSVMYGLPGETEKDVGMTIDMLKKMKLDAGEAYLAIPFPGTGLWKVAHKKGLVDDDMDFRRLRYDWGDDSVIVADKIDIERLKEFRQEFEGIFGKK
jgi:radical SAM superfamily enzyme YgiQ (UPF0313 family)